ncbi:hypothetical protein BJ508DRAFT_377233 [Ascobolus immersus RN42]|uniref:Uncharacterized protein n=1 Tax=Ascobolus immersus RN42 TaxID=1160509 RepID=A0A3N4I2D1_ASCIM|nr:hypothetical protein BJ508DRAFT_377233 [Ascobolus immersus RN42]
MKLYTTHAHDAHLINLLTTKLEPEPLDEPVTQEQDNITNPNPRQTLIEQQHSNHARLNHQFRALQAKFEAKMLEHQSQLEQVRPSIHPLLLPPSSENQALTPSNAPQLENDYHNLRTENTRLRQALLTNHPPANPLPKPVPSGPSQTHQTPTGPRLDTDPAGQLAFRTAAFLTATTGVYHYLICNKARIYFVVRNDSDVSFGPNACENLRGAVRAWEMKWEERRWEARERERRRWEEKRREARERERRRREERRVGYWGWPVVEPSGWDGYDGRGQMYGGGGRCGLGRYGGKRTERRAYHPYRRSGYRQERSGRGRTFGGAMSDRDPFYQRYFFQWNWVFIRKGNANRDQCREGAHVHMHTFLTRHVHPQNTIPTPNHLHLPLNTAHNTHHTNLLTMKIKPEPLDDLPHPTAEYIHKSLLRKLAALKAQVEQTELALHHVQTQLLVQQAPPGNEHHTNNNDDNKPHIPAPPPLPPSITTCTATAIPETPSTTPSFAQVSAKAKQILNRARKAAEKKAERKAEREAVKLGKRLEREAAAAKQSQENVAKSSEVMVEQRNAEVNMGRQEDMWDRWDRETERERETGSRYSERDGGWERERERDEPWRERGRSWREQRSETGARENLGYNRDRSVSPARYESSSRYYEQRYDYEPARRHRSPQAHHHHGQYPHHQHHHVASSYRHDPRGDAPYDTPDSSAQYRSRYRSPRRTGRYC